MLQPILINNVIRTAFLSNVLDIDVYKLVASSDTNTSLITEIQASSLLAKKKLV